MLGSPESAIRHMDAFSARVTQLTHLTSSAPGLLGVLHNFDRFDAASLVAGLLLAPECRPAVPRIEALVHAIVIGCAGSRKPKRSTSRAGSIGMWIARSTPSHTQRGERQRHKKGGISAPVEAET